MDFCISLKTWVKIQKTAEATGDLIGHKIADKIKNVSKNSTKELQNNKTEGGRASPKDIPKKDTYILTKGNKLLMN